MKFKELLNSLEVNSQIIEGKIGVRLNWLKQEASFDIFQFLDAKEQPYKLGNQADYLKFFMQLGELLHGYQKEHSVKYIFAVDLGGQRLFVKEFTKTEQETDKYSYVALLSATDELSEENRPSHYAFFSEVSLVETENESFEKESKKVERILTDESKEAWLEIAEKKLKFLKTDTYIYMLQKLHSWGFQVINPDGSLSAKQHLVRENRPKPRGMERAKRKKRA